MKSLRVKILVSVGIIIFVVLGTSTMMKQVNFMTDDITRSINELRILKSYETNFQGC